MNIFIVEAKLDVPGAQWLPWDEKSMHKLQVTAEAQVTKLVKKRYVVPTLFRVKIYVSTDYVEQVQSNQKELVRQLDIALNGDGAAPQASLCDLVAQFENFILPCDVMLHPSIHVPKGCKISTLIYNIFQRHQFLAQGNEL